MKFGIAVANIMGFASSTGASAMGTGAAQGVERVVVPPLSFDPSQIADALGAYGERVIARF